MPIYKDITRYFNGQILLNHELVASDLWVADGKVIAPQSTFDKEFDLKGKIVAPGLIDLQMNGGFGIDFSTSLEGIDKIAKLLPQFGVTAFLPTIVSSEKSTYKNAFAYIKNQKKSLNSADVLGFHLEGPFFNEKCCGAHDPNHLSYLSSSASIEDFYGNLEDVRIVTLAPEQDGSSNAIQFLSEQGIIVSAGHSNATYDEMKLAFKNGLKLVTHLFNAMSPLHHRDPSIVGFALTQKGIYYSLIVDGHHLHPAVVELAWKTHPEGLMLVTDASSALGLTEGTYQLGSKKIEVINGASFLAGSKTLAGSTVSLDKAMQNLRNYTGCTIAYAIDAASYRPAQLLGLTNKGHLGIGADADFIFLNHDMKVQACFIAGNLVWTDGSLDNSSH